MLIVYHDPWICFEAKVLYKVYVVSSTYSFKTVSLSIFKKVLSLSRWRVQGRDSKLTDKAINFHRFGW